MIRTGSGHVALMTGAIVGGVVIGALLVAAAIRIAAALTADEAEEGTEWAPADEFWDE